MWERFYRLPCKLGVEYCPILKISMPRSAISCITSSTSESIINETITSHQYRTGYSYSASGHNIKSETGHINPTATTTNEQTVGGVNFNWTSPNLESIPRWGIVNDGAAFSLQETLITPGLDTTTTITRQITTSTTTETTTTFGQ